MQSARTILPARAGPPPVFPLTLVSLCIIFFWAAPLYAAQKKPQKHGNPHREIDLLEEAWRKAVLASDIPAMNSLLAEDYTAINSNGTMQTKEDTLASLRAGRVHFTALDVSDRKIRFYGNTAVVTSRAEVQGTSSDGELFGSFRYTRVYVRNAQGKWKIVSFEASRIGRSRAIKTSSEQ